MNFATAASTPIRRSLTTPHRWSRRTRAVRCYVNALRSTNDVPNLCLRLITRSVVVLLLLQGRVVLGSQSLPTTIPSADETILFTGQGYNGTIPTEFGALTMLTALNLDQNTLTVRVVSSALRNCAPVPPHPADHTIIGPPPYRATPGNAADRVRRAHRP